MSIAPFYPEPIAFPETRFADVPPAFWTDIIAYRETRLRELTLSERDKINRSTIDNAADALAKPITLHRIETRGLEFALGKASERAKAYKRELIAYSLWSRDFAKAVNRRVPCGARKKDGAQCRAMTEPGRNRCRFHGGRSTGPRSLEGMRKALSCLPQYQNNPERLADKMAALSQRAA